MVEGELGEIGEKTGQYAPDQTTGETRQRKEGSLDGEYVFALARARNAHQVRVAVDDIQGDAERAQRVHRQDIAIADGYGDKLGQGS